MLGSAFTIPFPPLSSLVFLPSSVSPSSFSAEFSQSVYLFIVSLRIVGLLDLYCIGCVTVAVVRLTCDVSARRLEPSISTHAGLDTRHSTLDTHHSSFAKHSRTFMSPHVFVLSFFFPLLHLHVNLIPECTLQHKTNQPSNQPNAYAPHNRQHLVVVRCL